MGEQVLGDVPHVAWVVQLLVVRGGGSRQTRRTFRSPRCNDDAARCVRREERAFRRPHVHRVVSFLRDTVRVVRDERLEVDLLELDEELVRVELKSCRMSPFLGGGLAPPRPHEGANRPFVLAAGAFFSFFSLGLRGGGVLRRKGDEEWGNKRPCGLLAGGSLLRPNVVVYTWRKSRV